VTVSRSLTSQNACDKGARPVEDRLGAFDVPDFRALEWLGASMPFFDELCSVCIDLGFIAWTEAPGLGITLDEDIELQYAKPGEEFFS
jgi:hypothetical protein